MIFPWFSSDFRVFPGFSHSFSMVFPAFFHGDFHPPSPLSKRREEPGFQGRSIASWRHSPGG